MILRAKMVLPIVGPPIEDGAVAVAGEQIVAVGPAQEVCAAHTGEVRDLGAVVLLPGLINAHCHLDYTCLRGEVTWRGSFVDWLLHLVAAKKLHTDQDYAGAVERGAQELVQFGTTTVVNIAAFPAVVDLIPPLPLRIYWCFEMIDLKRDQSPEEIVRSVEQLIDERPALAGRYGFSPHAPYTASAGLYLLAGRAAQARGVPLTTHVAESQEEDDMIRRGTGKMYDYFTLAGRDMTDCKRVGPLQLLDEAGVLGPQCLAVHANALTPLDMQLLHKTGTHVVHCPKSHRYFNRGTPVLSALWELGVNICLGTDSLASNDSLNMFAEMQTLAQVYPRLPADKILEMATVAGARALRQSDTLGKLTVGATADLIAVRMTEPDPYEAVVFADQPVTFSMIGGKVVVG